MFTTLRSILQKATADYADIRYEVKRETKIVFNGKELYHIGSNSTDGFVLRILKHGGFSSIAFTREDDAEVAVRTAEENASSMALHIKEPVQFAKADVIKDTFLPELYEHPQHISIDEKLELTRYYNSIPLEYGKIATTNISYNEVIREKYYLLLFRQQGLSGNSGRRWRIRIDYGERETV